MFNKMKNILTFGLYNRLVEAESTLWTLADKYSELKRRSDSLESDIEEMIQDIENLDIDGAVEEEINKRDILTQDNFSPSDYDIVTKDDYDFDSFVSTDDYNFDDFMDYDDVQKELAGLVHESEIEEVIEKKNRKEIDNSVERIINDTILDLAHKVLEQRKEK